MVVVGGCDYDRDRWSLVVVVMMIVTDRRGDCDYDSDRWFYLL